MNPKSLSKLSSVSSILLISCFFSLNHGCVPSISEMPELCTARPEVPKLNALVSYGPSGDPIPLIELWPAFAKLLEPPIAKLNPESYLALYELAGGKTLQTIPINMWDESAQERVDFVGFAKIEQDQLHFTHLKSNKWDLAGFIERHLPGYVDPKFAHKSKLPEVLQDPDFIAELLSLNQEIGLNLDLTDLENLRVVHLLSLVKGMHFELCEILSNQPGVIVGHMFAFSQAKIVQIYTHTITKQNYCTPDHFPVGINTENREQHSEITNSDLTSTIKISLTKDDDTSYPTMQSINIIIHSLEDRPKLPKPHLRNFYYRDIPIEAYQRLQQWLRQNCAQLPG